MVTAGGSMLCGCVQQKAGEPDGKRDVREDERVALMMSLHCLRLGGKRDSGTREKRKRRRRTQGEVSGARKRESVRVREHSRSRSFRNKTKEKGARSERKWERKSKHVG
eukprot:5793654-Pleurochrysis_carterae.AAC.1